MNILLFTSEYAASLDALKAIAWPAADHEHYGDQQPNFSRQEFTLIATEGTETVGYITILFDAGVAQIEPLMVHPAQKGTGIGTQLLQAAEAQVKAMGAHKLWLETGADWKAKAFYEKHGYQVRAALPNHIGGREFVLMDKML